jgi:hypothetical protein
MMNLLDTFRESIQCPLYGSLVQLIKTDCKIIFERKQFCPQQSDPGLRQCILRL